MYIIKYPEKGRFSNEGTVAAWAKNEGDSVKKGDLLLQIEAFGEVLEIESVAEGTLLKVLAGVGRLVTSGRPLAILGQPGQDVSRVIEQLQEKKVAPVQQTLKEQARPAEQTQQKKKEEVMTPQQTAGNSESVIPILMPQAGQSMEEGTILSWKVKEGDRIEVGQVIMEIETDKATMEVEAADAGRIGRIIHQEGDIVKVKKPVAFIADSDADIDSYLTGEDAATPLPKSEPAPTSSPAPESKPELVATPEPAPAPAATPEKPAVSIPEGAVTPILMPQAGQSMEEGTILSWKVKEGDRIEVGQVIMEIETDKATMDVEAVDAGRIAKIVSQEGDIVKVKVPVAYLAEEDVKIDANLESGGTSTETPKPASGGQTVSTPTESVPADQKEPTSINETGSAGVTEEGTRSYTVSKMRRAIANNLLYSKQNIPHFYAKTTIDAGSLFGTYKKTKEQFKCSVNDFVTRACAKAMRQYPAFRSQYKDAEVIEHSSVNIGIAVGTDNGLMVPVIVDADRMNLEQLAARTRQIVESARNGKLEGMGQGLFTITNLGMFGVEEFSAIINPPESAILAIGAIREGVVVENGQMRPTRLMTVTLSSDHRVIDGILSAQFLQTLKELLEKPEQLIS